MIYEVTFKGEYLEGVILVRAGTRRKAFNLIKKTLEADGLWEKNKNLDASDLIEYEEDYEGIIYYEDGDY